MLPPALRSVAVAALIRDLDADLVPLQEIDSVTTRTGGVDQAAELGRLTGLEPAYGHFMPYQGGAYGMAILSRWPIAEVANHRLPDGEEPRTALAATVTLPTTGRSLRLAGDFNSTPDSEVVRLLAEAWEIVDKGDDHLTFPSFGPEREIDFVLLRPRGRFEVVDRRLLEEPVASDHRPVVVELVWGR